MVAMPDKMTLTEREAAGELSLSTRTLYTLRCKGAVPFLRVGGKILYSRDALRSWIAAQMQNCPHQ